MADFSSQCIYTNLKTTSALFTYTLFDFDNYVTQFDFFLERLFQADPQNPTPLHQEKKKQ